MYLKNLALIGFKSFADKTSLDFLPGITAIVGPNGCGKSNICDAVRWVLGEQSARALRGETMADVIFNGTETRKPLSMAEVSLTLGDVDKDRLRAAGLELEFNELTITRRVYRDGTSEYLINRTPCRLKDIQQLFMGTGLGRHSYSILAQGQITQIISTRPEDRRGVFEEAAGISKYKAQRKEALRKLEYTEQNLLRLSDLIREVKRQIGSLQRQAAKARRYKQLAQELEHLETQLARHNYDCLLHEIEQLNAAIGQYRAEVEATETRVTTLETELELTRQRIAELQDAITQAHTELSGLESEIARHKNRIQFNRQRMADTETREHSALDEIQQTEVRLQTAQAELDSMLARQDDLTRELVEAEQLLKERQDACHRLESELRQAQQALEQWQDHAFQAAQELTRVRNQLLALENQIRTGTARLQKLNTEKARLTQELASTKTKLETVSGSAQNHQQFILSQRATIEQIQSSIADLDTRLQQVLEQIEALSQQQTRVRSNLELLKQLEAARDGYTQAAVAALKVAEFAMGSLADKIRVPEPYVAAIEAALGHYLELVLTAHEDAARRLLAEVRANNHGRARIAALSLCTKLASLYQAQSPRPVEAPGRDGIVPAVTVVTAEESVRPLIEALLGRTMIVPDLDTAIRCLNDGLAGFDFVTHSGEMLNRFGIFTGGGANGTGHNPGSILARKNQIEALESELTSLGTQLDEAERLRAALHAELQQQRTALSEALELLRQCELQVATAQAEINSLNTTTQNLQEQLQAIEFEIEALESELASASTQRVELQQQLHRLEQEQAVDQRRNEELKAELATISAERDAAIAAVTEVKVRVAALKQEFQAVLHQTDSANQRIAELRERIRQRRAEIESGHELAARARAEIKESESVIQQLAERQVAALQRMNELQVARAAAEQQLTQLQDQLRTLRQEAHQSQQKLRDAEIALAQKQLMAQNIKDQIRQRYQVDLDQVRSECIRIIFADEGPAKVYVVPPEEMAASGLATDWDAVAQHVNTLKAKLDEMGPVNLVALEEFDAVQERYQFLTKQYEELVQAKTQLTDLINRINAQSRQLFLETFEKIRQNFRELFVEVFGGGKADLYLVDEADVLESGIEIVARPPGKQTQSISLLSGGEQTMTAVALLFAIYQVRPSPFCVLDELDAALDEANINRFIRLVQRFTNTTQFIIITHNKRTISLADVIYGATMEEKGVSKVVSVRFQKQADPPPTQQIATAGETGFATERPETEPVQEELQPAATARP